LQDSGATWKPRLVDQSLSVVHGILVLDWDGDGRDELLTASFEGVHLFHSAGPPENLRWTKVHLAEGEQNWKLPGVAPSAQHRGSSEIGVGNVASRRFPCRCLVAAQRLLTRPSRPAGPLVHVQLMFFQLPVSLPTVEVACWIG
jgi:hypothetical protein